MHKTTQQWEAGTGAEKVWIVNQLPDGHVEVIAEHVLIEHAPLIAASPKLLDAAYFAADVLRECAEFLASGSGTDQEAAHALKLLHEAIASATGRRP